MEGGWKFVVPSRKGLRGDVSDGFMTAEEAIDEVLGKARVTTEPEKDESDFGEVRDDGEFGRVIWSEVEEIEFRRFMDKMKRHGKRLLDVGRASGSVGGPEVGNRVALGRQRHNHCSQCGFIGHNIRTCPSDKPFCSSCCTLGHETISCPLKKPAKQPSSSVAGKTRAAKMKSGLD